MFNYKKFFIDLMLSLVFILVCVCFAIFVPIINGNAIIMMFFFLFFIAVRCFPIMLCYFYDRNSCINVDEKGKYHLFKPKSNDRYFNTEDIHHIVISRILMSRLCNTDFITIFLKDGSNIKITCYLPVEEIIQQVDPSKVFKSVSPLLIGLLKK